MLRTLQQTAPRLAPLRVWEAYARLDEIPENAAPLTELTALMALIRRACGIDEKLTPFNDTVRRNFQTWIMQRHAGTPTGEKFTEAQTAWPDAWRQRHSRWKLSAPPARSRCSAS